MTDLKIMERPLLVGLAYVSGVVLAGALIGLWRYGIDLASVFLGTHWSSHLPRTNGTLAIEGALVFITLVFGGLLIFSMASLILNKRLQRQPQGKAG